MLSGLKLRHHFRNLTEETFPETVRLGRRTIIYGHNGSGKSSLAELLHQISRAEHSEPITWLDKNSKKTKLAPYATLPFYVSVFCKTWVHENVSDFLEGDSAGAIVTLGEKAKHAAEEEKRLQKEVKNLEAKTPHAKDDWTSAARATTALVRSVQNSIVDTLRDIAPDTYTKNRYNEPKVRQLLSETQEKPASEVEHNNNLEKLRAGKMDPIELPSFPGPEWEDLVEDTQTLLSQEVQGELLEALLGNPALQKWLEDGLVLHDHESTCHFCHNPLSRKRIGELKRHFDDSRKEVQRQATQLRDQIASNKEKIEKWQENFPKASQLYPELRGNLKAAVLTESTLLQKTKDALLQLDAVLAAKFDLPERTTFELNLDIPTEAGEAIATVCDRHDELTEQAEVEKLATADKVLTYLLSTQAEAFHALSDDEDDKKKAHEELLSDLEVQRESLRQIRAEQFSSKEMADSITHDLAVVYGRNHLSIEVSPDGTTYRCMRDGRPAYHLSEGERNTLALVYFLRHLEDKQKDINPNQRLVVIDDPSSSLDREAVFATHSWLLDSLQKYGQTIILTHDFEMLRLFLNSQKSQLSTHRGLLKRGVSTEATSKDKAAMTSEKNFPRISFLEMRATGAASSRRAELVPLSSAFLDFQSEYHFLFDRILTGIETPDDHELLFLLPNAARRVLEAFTSFHVPGRTQFEQQLKKIAREDCNEAYRDVYDFCNRFSHGEGREPQLILDASTVARQIVRCMELLKVTAPTHYENMCKAVGRRDYDPLTNQPW